MVANETVGGRAPATRSASDRAAADARVLVVCPALNSPLRHWASDEDGARQTAQERLERASRRCAVRASRRAGEIGDGDPIQAIEDALRTFGPDELIISTHPLGPSHWLERGVVEKARERFALPVTHVSSTSSDRLIEIVARRSARRFGRELREVHRSALGAGALSDEWASERLPRHARARRLRLPRRARRREVVGFGYGYTGAYGQWWTDHVSRALTDGQRAEWLDPPHFEIVELHVRPA